MQLLIVRHARAEDRDRFAVTRQPDALRPLTRKGIRRMTGAARGLRQLVPSIDVLIASPLRRAIETARIISDAYGGVKWIERDELSPGTGAEQVVRWLATQPQKGVIAIVGHEPDLSELLARVVASKSELPSKLKKGSASLVSFEGAIAAASGKLLWHRTARELADA